MSSGYEKSDARVAPLVLFGVALTLLVVVSMWLVGRIDRALRAEREGESVEHPMRAFRKPPEEPLLQAVPASEMEAHQRAEEEVLSTYGWVDRTNGIARVPVERAMQILNERGMAARSSTDK